MKRVSTSNLASSRESWINRITSVVLIVFVLSLPLNAMEWDVIRIERFELKITMITFLILFIAWFMKNILFQRKRTTKEKLFYFLAFMYASSQFLSLINSPYPMESLKVAVIMVCLLSMMIVVSETVSDRETALSVLTAMGSLSLIIATVAIIPYYFFNSDYARLGQSETKLMGIIDLGGDAYYFGDILLFSIGAVFFLIMKLFQKRHLKLFSLTLMVLWFSALIITYTKSLIIAVVSFLLISFFLLKEKKSFILLCLILLIAAIIVNSESTKYFQLKELAKKDTFIRLKEPAKTEKNNLSDNILKLNGTIQERFRINRHAYGFHSLEIRLKAIRVSLINSMDYCLFGHGAGLSQKLLPHMADIEDKKIEVGSYKHHVAMHLGTIGSQVNSNLIDSHVLFITEFFNVGIVGALSLTCLVLFVLIELFRVVKTSIRETDHIPSLLFATIISMLIYRLFASLIVIPFLWFMLGFAFGVCKIYWETYTTGKRRQEV